MVKVNRKEDETMREGYVDNCFASLYYKEMGQGTPLIMLHGNGESHEIFARLSELMSRYYRVILMDSRGHGSSLIKGEAARGELTIPDMAADVVQVMEFLHVPRAVILGFSDGANVALETASCYPGRVSAVVAVSGNALPKGMSTASFMEVKIKYALWRGLEKIPLPRGVRDKAVKSRQLLGLMARWPRLDKEKLSSIQAPVLILTGRRDMIRPRHSLWMGEQIPDAKVVFVKGADHFTLLKKEKAYGAHIMAWLRQRGL